MGKFRSTLVVILCLALLAPLGCSAPPVDDSNTLKVAVTEEQETADVQLTTWAYTLPLNLYDRLVEAKTTGPLVSEIVPGLAERWDISPDGKVYTFYLRQGVKFHNGEELKADDVLFTFDRMLNPATKAMNADFMDMIAGGQERLEGVADAVSGLKVIDEYTIEITLAEPYAPFLANIATPAGSIYNRKATEAAGEKFGIDPALTVGTGPFKLTEWVVNDHMTMEAFDDYYLGRPSLDKILVKVVPDADTQRMLFETGDLDVFDCDNARTQIPYFESHETWGSQIVSGPRVGVYYYCINESIKPFNDVRVRKALQMAIDRQTILDTLYYGKGQIVNTIMPPGLFGYNPAAPQIAYDPERAKALLAEAGYPNGFDMVIAQITDRPATLRINEAVQSMLKEVGINVDIQQMDSAAWFATRGEGKLPMYHSDWSADFNDPDNFIYTFFAPRNSVNRSFNYNNARVATQLENARTMTDPAARSALYQEIEKQIVIEDAAWIPLFSLEHLFIVQPRVKNFSVSWNGWSSMSYYGISIEE